MVPISFHELSLRPRPRSRPRPRFVLLVSRTRTRTRTRRIGFMAPTHIQFGEVFAFHEPGGTSNIEHPTPNIEWQRASSLTSMFGVRCWTFDVFPRFRGVNAHIFISGNSLPWEEGRGEGGRDISTAPPERCQNRES